MRIGLIQSRGLGDIIIAVPIAQYYLRQGLAVYWPVDQTFYMAVRHAFPGIHFIPLSNYNNRDKGVRYFLEEPLEILNKFKCDRIIPLYSYLSGLQISHQGFYGSLKFDEYKYAIAGVQFKEKWNLKITRDISRERDLYERVVKKVPYMLIHDEGSNVKLDIERHIGSGSLNIIKISSLTDNPFDWLTVIERAQCLHFIDSSFANLAEQLEIDGEKYLYLRSDVRFTPVFKNWTIRSV